MNEYTFLSVNSVGLILEVYLNDVPLVKDATGSGERVTIPANSWLRTKNNQLRVKLAYAPLSEGMPADPEEVAEFPKPTAEIRLYRHDPNSETPSVGAMLAEFKWPQEEINMYSPFEETLQIEESFDYPADFELWNRSSQIDALSDSDESEIIRIANELLSALETRNFSQAFELLRTKYTEDAIAEGKGLERLREVVIELWSEHLGTGSTETTRFQPDQYTFKIVGNGALVHLEGPEEMPAVVFEDKEEEQFIGVPLYFSKLAGKWTIIR